MDNNQVNQQPVNQQSGQSINGQTQNYQQSCDSQINGQTQNNRMNNTQPYQPNYNQQGYNQQPIYQTYSQQAYNQQQVNQTYGQQAYNQQQVNQTYGQQAYNQQQVNQTYGQQAYNQQQVNQTYGQQVYNQPQVNQTYGQQVYNQQPYQNYNQPYPRQPVQSGKANAALVCGILSILISPLCLIFAIISIVNAVGSKKQTGGKMVGKAVAGVVCSVISLVVGFIVTALLCGILAPSLIGYTNKANILNDYQVCQSVSTALITAAMDPEVISSPDFTLPADGDYELDEFLDETGSTYKYTVYDILGINSSSELSSQLKAKGHNGSNEDNGFRVIVEDSQGYVDFNVYIPNSCDQGAVNCSNCEPISSY